MTGEQILVVDDNTVNLKLARVVLQIAGFEVRTAMDAEEALDVLRSYRPKLILMDIQLPGMDGLSLTRQLKSDPATRDITVVALTAYAMRGDEDKALASGCAGYITKPLDTRRLAEEVVRFLAEAA